jgi:hypothetical protein
MREIKFRVRTGSTILGYEKLVNGEWQWAKKLSDGGVGIWRSGVFNTPGLQRDEFTGLKDKNGAEIYEADVVVLHDWRPAQNDKKLYVIEWALCGLRMRRIDSDVLGYMDIRVEQTGRLEVIGNIYENQELGPLPKDVRCNNCMGEFNEDQLELMPDGPDSHFKACPVCHTDSFLMDTKEAA